VNYVKKRDILCKNVTRFTHFFSKCTPSEDRISSNKRGEVKGEWREKIPNTVSI
jgi:hypothetical protein